MSLSELCRRFGISRDTGHRLIRRYEEAGEAGLNDRSRRPSRSPRRTEEKIERQVLEIRDQHRAWGGRKIARRLKDLGLREVPSASTITEILRRHERLDPADASKHRPFKRFEYESPNALWQMDFKGHFPTAEGRCHPLTVLDDHSRYAVGLRACGDETEGTVREKLTALFRCYGLPQRILADNGPPWGSCGQPDRYTALAVWLMRLGIDLRHGRPRHPQTQGKDERFHRSLVSEVLQCRHFQGLDACQAAFDDWRRIYNEVRPHQALGLETPATRYQPSPRACPDVVPEPEYLDDDQVRNVLRDGYFNFKARRFKISSAFTGYRIALRPNDKDGIWTVYFASFAVAQVDLRNGETRLQPVRHVSERVSDMSPV